MNIKSEKFDYIVIGAGIYGLYSALFLAPKNAKIAIVEHDSEAFQRATFVNQARVHNGYHYPRSISTALKTASYFKKFQKDFDFAINASFKKIYALAKNFSFTDAEQFEKFCRNAAIPCSEISASGILNYDTIEKAYETDEYAFDANLIKKHFLAKLANYPNVTFYYSTYPEEITKAEKSFVLSLNGRRVIESGFVINATYAGINQVIDKFGFEKFKIKYEVCEIITCRVSKNLENVGLTVMDGPFFSVMPFGLGGLHSLTSVEFTPHIDSHEELPVFPCQKRNTNCSPEKLENCNHCPARPHTAWIYMRQLAKKYLSEEVDINYDNSYFAIKPILKMSELDDSRPTVIRSYSNNPTFISVLSGKINTIYDLDHILNV